MIDPTIIDPAASMVAVDRAARALRRGSFVVLEGDQDSALIQAAETVTTESLATLTRIGNGHTSLALTARRAQVLDLPHNGADVVSLPLAATIDAATIRWLADPTFVEQAPAPRAITFHHLDGDRNASAAVTLSKLAQLLPAALTAPLPNDRLEAFAAGGHLLRVPIGAIVDYSRHAADTLRPVSEARVPLAAAENARVVAFRPADGGIEQLAILIGDPAANQPALCRLHGECFTGDLLGSLRCDCGPQLHDALRLMGEAGHGVLLYLAHEGRGIGLINKLRAYQLQDLGLDTVDANQHLGFEPDERSYRAAVVMLRQLGIDRIRLLTNNPAKVDALRAEGIEVVERVKHASPPNPHNHGYLETKARRAGHLL